MPTQDPLEQFALQAIDQDGANVSARVAEAFDVSRQAASARLRAFKKKGLIESTGTGRGTRYHLCKLADDKQSYRIEGLSEDLVWDRQCAPVVRNLAENVRDMWHYGITEMVNNAIDHSGSEVVQVHIWRDALRTSAIVADEGEGIFHKIQHSLELLDPREAILELAKGKLTTDPERHSGEGIFFTSKMFDAFVITSRNLYFRHDADEDLDILLEQSVDETGTTVFLQLSNDSGRKMKEVFDEFAAPEEYTFSKTVVPVRLAQHEGEKLVSRSQAKRLTARFEKFEHVVLDFEGVEEIGQAFADEVFRVFQRAHPGTLLAPMNMTEAVEDMVKRARAAARG
ncbi:STAS-like domain-containing protein [Thiohalomonas denitrificans]|uniref:STAS-like domain-containing protein n=1 Tax=Thiohalomonas denitrificans TaxID=415747 RepID=UPI0026E9B430|nr:DUF4325 domain-containing protein [Thiohalomonas denitrificans]